MASQITAVMVTSLIHRLICAVFMDPNSPQWTNCSKLSFPSLHNTLLMRKCDSGCWLITVLSHAHCQMPSHKMQT